jgi:hypothetical protein
MGEKVLFEFRDLQMIISPETFTVMLYNNGTKSVLKLCFRKVKYVRLSEHKNVWFYYRAVLDFDAFKMTNQMF